MAIIPYLLLKGIWSYHVKREAEHYHMDGGFWFLSAFLIPLWAGFFIYFRTRDRVLESQQKNRDKKYWPILESVLLLGLLVYLLWMR